MSYSESPFNWALKTVTLSHSGDISCSGLGKGPRIFGSTETLQGEGLQVIDARVSVHRFVQATWLCWCLCHARLYKRPGSRVPPSWGCQASHSLWCPVTSLGWGCWVECGCLFSPGLTADHPLSGQICPHLFSLTYRPPPPPVQDTRTYCHPWVWAGTKDGEGTYLCLTGDTGFWPRDVREPQNTGSLL